MDYLNYEFFDEFKALDNLCRDIYGKTSDNKLGVTLYLEDMEQKTHLGAVKVSGWAFDYRRLKSARNMRNELAHSRNSMSVEICTQEDIDFVRNFRERILNQTDPIAVLKKQLAQSRDSSRSRKKKKFRMSYSYAVITALAVCLCITALIVIVSFA
ncbi:MAG: hypothetical protein IKU43_02490 [Clostridia bacterium]|nr:hypothetical protein [Clostridia bacterium]